MLATQCRDILLVLDSLIIASDAKDIAHRLGAASVPPAPRWRARSSPSMVPPAFAILDTILGDRYSSHC